MDIELNAKYILIENQGLSIFLDILTTFSHYVMPYIFHFISNLKVKFTFVRHFLILKNVDDERTSALFN